MNLLLFRICHGCGGGVGQLDAGRPVSAASCSRGRRTERTSEAGRRRTADRGANCRIDMSDRNTEQKNKLKKGLKKMKLKVRQKKQTCEPRGSARRVYFKVRGSGPELRHENSGEKEMLSRAGGPPASLSGAVQARQQCMGEYYLDLKLFSSTRS